MEINIVTGGTSGLGFCIAKVLVKAGRNVVIIGRNKDKMDHALTLLKAINPHVKALGFAFDIGKSEAVKAFYDQLASQYTITALVNAAGIGYFGPSQSINSSQVAAMLDTNLKGLIFMTSYVIDAMATYGGKIVNIVSTAGLKGKANESVYCASKWGARGYTESLKAELKGSKILIYGVYPGGMVTDFWKDTGLAADNFMDPDQVAATIVKNTLMSDLYVSDLIIERH